HRDPTLCGESSDPVHRARVPAVETAGDVHTGDGVEDPSVVAHHPRTERFGRVTVHIDDLHAVIVSRRFQWCAVNCPGCLPDPGSPAKACAMSIHSAAVSPCV